MHLQMFIPFETICVLRIGGT